MISGTGKYFSEALILASTNPQYNAKIRASDKDLPVKVLKSCFKCTTRNSLAYKIEN